MLDFHLDSEHDCFEDVISQNDGVILGFCERSVFAIALVPNVLLGLVKVVCEVFDAEK